VTNISQSFTYTMEAAKINWHRYGTKLRHCHPVHKMMEQWRRLQRRHLATAQSARTNSFRKCTCRCCEIRRPMREASVQKHVQSSPCFYRAALYASAVYTSWPCVRLCLSQVWVLSKRMNESNWLWHGSFLRPITHCVLTKFAYLQNKGIVPSRRSSLWITPIRRSTRRCGTHIVYYTSVDRNGVFTATELNWANWTAV